MLRLAVFGGAEGASKRHTAGEIIGTPREVKAGSAQGGRLCRAIVEQAGAIPTSSAEPLPLPTSRIQTLESAPP